MPDRVSDEVWRRLNPCAGGLSRRTRRRLLGAAILVVLLIVAGGYGWHLGLLTPRLRAGMNSYSTSPDQVTVDLTLTNGNASAPVEVRDLGRGGPGLELIDSIGSTSDILAPGEAMTVTLVYRITDCDEVPRESWPVPVEVARWWGIQTVDVHPPEQVSLDAPDGERSFSGRDPYAVGWQRYLAELACTEW